MKTVKTKQQGMIPTQQDQLLAQGDLVTAALKKHGASIGVKHNPAAAVKTDVTAFRKLDLEFQARRENRKKQLTPEQSAVDGLAGDLIQQTKSVVAREFGKKFNQSWALVGFTDSLSMPKSLAEREAMLERISTFLAANPRFENEKLGVTSANALSLHQRLNAARSATSEMKSDTRNISRARTAARAQLKRRLSDLAGELKILLPADDSRWLLFGLTPPAERLAARKATREAQSGRSTGKATVPATGGAEKDRPAAAPVPAAGGENGGVTKQTPLSA